MLWADFATTITYMKALDEFMMLRHDEMVAKMNLAISTNSGSTNRTETATSTPSAAVW